MTQRIRHAVAAILAAIQATPHLVAGPAAADETAANAPQENDPQRDAVLAAVDAFFIAFAAKDTDALTALMGEEGFVRALRPGSDGAPRERATAIPDWIADVPGDDHTLRELYWEPVIHIRGPLASVWTPYEVFVDGETFQCGIDLFTLTDTGEGWRITDLAYTAEPTACAELRPASSDALRPADLATRE